VEKLRRQIEALPLGPVTDASAAVGPLISETSRTRVRSALEANGARAVHGGAVPADPQLDRGFFLTPALVLDPDDASPLVRDELSGPVLAVQTATDIAAALAIAHRTRYGLSASLFTRDLRAALTYI